MEIKNVQFDDNVELEKLLNCDKSQSQVIKNQEGETRMFILTEDQINDGSEVRF